MCFAGCTAEMQPLVPDSNIDVPTDTIITLKAGEQLNIPIDAYKGSATPTATLVDVFGTVRAVPANIMRIADRQWIVVKSTNLELVTGKLFVRLADVVVLSAAVFVQASEKADPKLELSTCKEYSEEEMAGVCGAGGCVVDFYDGTFRRLDVPVTERSRIITIPHTTSIVGLVDGLGLFRQIQRWNFRSTPNISVTCTDGIVTGTFVTCLPTADYSAGFYTAFDSTVVPIIHNTCSFPLGLATACKVVLYENGRPINTAVVGTSFVKAEMTFSLKARVSYSSTLRVTTASGSESDEFPGTTVLSIPNTRVTNMMLRTSDSDVSLLAQFQHADLVCSNGKVSGNIYRTQTIVDKGRTFIGTCRLEFRDARLVDMPGQNGYSVDMSEASFRPHFSSDIHEGTHTWTLKTDSTWLPARDVLTFSFAESAD